MLKWSNKSAINLLTICYGFKYDPTRKYVYKKLSDGVELSIYEFDDFPYEKFDVVISTDYAVSILDLDLLYELIRGGYICSG